MYVPLWASGISFDGSKQACQPGIARQHLRHPGSLQRLPFHVRMRTLPRDTNSKQTQPPLTALAPAQKRGFSRRFRSDQLVLYRQGKGRARADLRRVKNRLQTAFAKSFWAAAEWQVNPRLQRRRHDTGWLATWRWGGHPVFLRPKKTVLLGSLVGFLTQEKTASHGAVGEVSGWNS